MAQTILINAFEVPEGQDEAFLAGWEESRKIMARQPGYVSTRLHQSLDPEARFRYVNVAVWESPQAFQAALESRDFTANRERVPFTNYPSLYSVIREY
jgi:heme-degrading monooxygenase HmoA